MTEKQVDILIVGGGLVGASLMLALAAAGLDVLLVDEKSGSSKISENFDARSIALSPASVNILKSLNVWSLLEPDACPISTIHISDRGKFGRAELKDKLNSPLGFVVEMQHISCALKQSLQGHKVIECAQLIGLDQEKSIATVEKNDETIAIKANLIIAADGANSTVRRLSGLSVNKKIYDQHAVVANIGLSRSHHNIAYERFTATGPIAMLPMRNNRSALVWALPPEDAKIHCELSENDFLKKLQYAFGYRLGRFIKAGNRITYPLAQVVMPSQVSSQIVFVGNAAHTLHPIAGQGFNLGLRDVAMLAQCIVNDGLDVESLKNYQQCRAHDQKSIIKLTDGLISSFSSKIPGIGLAKMMGLVAFDNTPAFKNLLSRYASGFAGVTPDLACNIPLSVERLT